MGKDVERDYEDEVYEDEYYDENFDEEELIDEDDIIDEEITAVDGKDLVDEDGDESDELEGDDEEPVTKKKNIRKVEVSFACEDCDYRWEDVIIKRKDLEDTDEIDVVCPMCGSTTITQI
jgi:hypothetical protein